MIGILYCDQHRRCVGVTCAWTANGLPIIEKKEIRENVTVRDDCVQTLGVLSCYRCGWGTLNMVDSHGQNGTLHDRCVLFISLLPSGIPGRVSCTLSLLLMGRYATCR